MGEAKRRRQDGSPPPRDELQALIDLGERHARRMLLEERAPELQAFYHLIAADGRHAIVPCQWRNSLEKDLMVLVVKEAARQLDAVAALFVSETWMVKADVRGHTAWHQQRAKERLMATPPSENPDRIEVVFLAATDGERTRSRALQMVRDRPGGRLIALVQDIDGMPTEVTGRMLSGILPRR